MAKKLNRKETTMKNDGVMQLISACNIQAAQVKEGEPEKLPTFEISAYNGGKMEVDFWGEVVVDLAGMEVRDVTPILYGHNSYTIDSVLGQTSKVEKGDTLKASGMIMGDSSIVKRFLTLSRNGFKFQASVGTTVLEYKDIEEGASAEVNGQTIEGPFTLAAKSKLKEISIVPLGADSTTETSIAAKQGGKPKAEEREMKDSEKQEAPTAEMIRAEAVTEQNRIMKVKEVAKDYPEISAQAVKDGWDEGKTSGAVKDKKIADLEAKIKADEEANKRPKAPGMKVEGSMKFDIKTIEAAAALRAGLTTVEKVYDSETLNKASEIKLHSITDLVRAGLAMSGKKLDHSRHETREFLQAAFSTRDIANVLSNLANKFILEGYGTVEETWKTIAAIRSVVDFKVHTGSRLIMTNLLQAMGPGGEISHGSLSDETRTVQADTKALMLGVTRKDLINDDLNALSDLPRRLGFAAARTFNIDFWAVLNAASGEFTNARGNTTTGALTITTLSEAERLFMSLTDADGNSIGMDATVLLTGSTAATPARELFVSTNLTSDASARKVQSNIYVGKFTPAISKYATAAPWFLVSSPLSMPLMQTAFLNGRQEPYVETSDADFNTLGIQLRCYFDYGVAFGEYRGSVRSTGV
jgi:hypothetical protein